MDKTKNIGNADDGGGTPPRDLAIRHATPEDVPALAALELATFPAAQAATPEEVADRVAHYPECFWLLVGQGDGDPGTGGPDEAGRTGPGAILAAVNGFVTDHADLTDDMYARAADHDPGGAWQMIFSVATDSAHQHRGLASMLMRRVVADARAAGRRGIVLTCLRPLVGFYARFGFEDEGFRGSTHGDKVWHQMRLTFRAATAR